MSDHELQQFTNRLMNPTQQPFIFTPRDVELKNLLFDIQTNEGQGDCFFRAVSQWGWLTQEHHLIYRNLLFHYYTNVFRIRETHAAGSLGEKLQAFFDKKGEGDKHLRRGSRLCIRNQGQEATVSEDVWAMAHYLGIRIIVIFDSVLMGGQGSMIYEGQVTDIRRTMFLLYSQSRAHYELMEIRKQCQKFFLPGYGPGSGPPPRPPGGPGSAPPPPPPGGPGTAPPRPPGGPGSGPPRPPGGPGTGSRSQIPASKITRKSTSSSRKSPPSKGTLRKSRPAPAAAAAAANKSATSPLQGPDQRFVLQDNGKNNVRVERYRSQGGRAEDKGRMRNLLRDHWAVFQGMCHDGKNTFIPDSSRQTYVDIINDNTKNVTLYFLFPPNGVNPIPNGIVFIIHDSPTEAMIELACATPGSIPGVIKQIVRYERDECHRNNKRVTLHAVPSSIFLLWGGMGFTVIDQLPGRGGHLYQPYDTNLIRNVVRGLLANNNDTQPKKSSNGKLLNQFLDKAPYVSMQYPPPNPPDDGSPVLTFKQIRRLRELHSP